MLLVILIYINKLILTLAAAIIAVSALPYKGFFSYSEDLTHFGLPNYLYSLANFDGIHYIKIALLGYSQYEQAFFPFFPLLIRFLTSFFGNPVITGLLISNLSLLIGLVFFYKLLLLIENRTTALWIIAFIICFPTAFYFNGVYTESLYFMLTSISLYLLKKRNLLWSGVFGAFSSLTRFIGVLLFLPFLSIYSRKSRTHPLKFFLYIASPLLGLFIYMLYLYKTTGNPLSFFSSLSAFGVGRSTNLVLLPQVYFRYFRIFFTADFSFAYMISLLEFTVFTFFFFVSLLEAFRAHKNKDYFLLGIALYSAAALLLPTLTGSFTSIPRYALLAPAPFFFLAHMKNKAVKVCVFIGFSLLQVLLFAFFLQGYFVA